MVFGGVLMSVLDLCYIFMSVYVFRIVVPFFIIYILI